MGDTLTLLRAALASAANPEQLAKAATFVAPLSTTTGLQDYDLSPAVLNLYPVLTPLRNTIPRVGGGKAIAANWKAVTSINATGVRVGVSEGHRGSMIKVDMKDFMAAYRTLGTEAAVTDEAELAAADFDDVRARAAKSGLEVLMLNEEKILLGGNTSYNLGVTPTPILASSATGGALPASTTLSFIVVALTFEGRLYSTVAGGITAQVSRTTVDGYTDNFGGGVGQRSAAATIGTSPSATNTVTATVPAVRGAYSYAWFGGAPGAEALFAITYMSQVTMTTMPSGTQLAVSLPNTDYSTNSLVFDGLLTMAGNPANGAGYLIAQPGAGLTADGNGGVVEFDQILQDYWDRLRLSPTRIMVSSQEMLWIRRKVLTGTSISNSRFTFNVQQGQIVGGGQLKGYTNSFAVAGGLAEIPITVHPDMPPGTVLFLTDTLPYVLNNITNVLQVRTRRDYYQTEWPRRTRAYEYGVYTDQVLQNFFMPGMYVLTNLSPA